MVGPFYRNRSGVSALLCDYGISCRGSDRASHAGGEPSSAHIIWGSLFMSPMRVGTLVSAATVSTATLLLMVFSAGPLHGFGVPDNVHRVLVVASGMLWLGHLAAYLRDTVLEAMDERAAGIGRQVASITDRLGTLEAAIVDFGDQQAAEGQVAALRSMTAQSKTNGASALGRIRAVDQPGLPGAG
jgi:hypothetical protein